MGKTIRKSNLELLRIISMWMIVFYHLHIHVICPEDGWLRAVQMPLHVAVICFVLISGYFGIRYTGRGLVKLVTQVLFYALVSFGAIAIYYHFWPGWPGVTLTDALASVLCVSRTDLWFVRTYVMLFIAAPFINRIIDTQTDAQRLSLIGGLALISMYIGGMGIDESVADGKNLVNFILIYCIGRYIAFARLHTLIGYKWWLVAYAATFAVAVTAFITVEWSALSAIIWQVAFAYNGPVLILGAVFLFLFFAGMDFSSRVVNYVASATFGVYLLHEGLIGPHILYPALSRAFPVWDAHSYLALLGISVVIFVVAAVFDRLTAPLQQWLSARVYAICHTLKLKLVSRFKTLPDKA